MSQTKSAERFVKNHPRTVAILNVSNDQLRALLSRPVAYNKLLSIAGGSVGAGVFLSQMIYWYEHPGPEVDQDGWIYKTREDWWLETAISRYELETIRKTLVSRSLIKERLSGVPAKLYYRIDWDGLRSGLASAMESHAERVNKRSGPANAFTPKESAALPVATPPPGRGQRHQQAGGTATNYIGSESTSESTTENTTTTNGSRSVAKTIVSSDRERSSSLSLDLAAGEGIPLVADDDEPRSVVDRLQEKYLLDDEQTGEVEAWTRDAGVDYVTEKERVTDSEPRKKPGAFFMTALRKNFRQAVSTIPIKVNGYGFAPSPCSASGGMADRPKIETEGVASFARGLREAIR